MAIIFVTTPSLFPNFCVPEPCSGYRIDTCNVCIHEKTLAPQPITSV